MAAWTQEQLTALETAIARGTLRVKYGERDVTYRSLDEMLKLRGVMRRELGLVDPAGGRRVVSFRKGTT
jgi:hypothetical protein